MNGTAEIKNDVLVVNLPDNENETLDFLLAQNGYKKVKVTGVMKEWHLELNEWVRENEIVFLDLYDLSEMKEWGNPRIYEGFPGGGIYWCDTLEEVILPKNLKGLGIRYFEGCDALHTIHFPANLEYMEGDFESRGLSETGLTKIHIELTEKNAWLLSYYYDMDIEYTIKSKQYAQVDGVLIDLKNRELVKFPKEFQGTYEISSEIISIADYAFSQSKAKQVIVPGTIQNFGYSVFRNAEINTLIFGEGIKALNESTFYNAKIVTLVLPGSLREIGKGTFTGLKIDKEITFRGNNTFWDIHDGLIYNLNEKSVVGYIPNADNRYVIREGTKIIGKDAFAFPRNLADIYSKAPENYVSVSLPNDLMIIDDNAFLNCPIKEITLPDELTSIGESAFADTPIQEIVIPDSVTTIKENAFSGCHFLQNARLPNSLKEIENSMFSFCYSLMEVNLPDEVSVIGSFSFGLCRALKTIKLPDSLREIGSEAFRECEALEVISFPESLEKIEYKAFEKCNSLKEAILPESTNYLGYEAFANCTSLETVYIPDACEIESPKEWGYQFEGCTSLSNVQLSDNNPNYTIVDGLLCNKNGDFLIKSFSKENIVEIPDRVRIIGPKAFANTLCSVVIMPDSIIEINSMAFRNCTELTHIRFSRNVEKINVEKFWEEGLYPGDLKGPYGSLFDECAKLKKITNVPAEIKQNYNDVFTAIPDVITVEIPNIKKKDGEKPKTPGPVIPEKVLEAITSKYFANPKEVNRLLDYIIKHQNEELVSADQPYLNSVRKLLEIIRNQLQQLGIIPQRCTALNTGLKILRNNWPKEVVPDDIRNHIVNILAITNSGSHVANRTKKQFDNFGYTNNDIVRLCLFVVKYIEYITDYCIYKKYDRQKFEREFEAVIYGSFKPDITLFSTTGIVRSWEKLEPKIGESKRIIEVIHQDNSWRKISLNENVLKEYYLETVIVIEEDQTIKVQIVERINSQNNPDWIGRKVLGIVKKEPLFDIPK